jgi:hypothetical protein
MSVRSSKFGESLPSLLVTDKLEDLEISGSSWLEVGVGGEFFSHFCEKERTNLNKLKFRKAGISGI